MNKRINQYEIKETIATGGMATIYRAVQISLGREVVIKKLHPHLAEDANFVRRFKREAAILAKLQHKNIVSIIDFFEDSGDQFIVLEYIKGFTLHDLIKSKKNIPFPISMFVLSEVCNGLKYIHSNNILHRDLKPFGPKPSFHNRSKSIRWIQIRLLQQTNMAIAIIMSFRMMQNH